MEYRSIADLTETLMRTAWKLPGDIDLIVGIPRSGLLAGNILALQQNLPLLDLDSFLDGRTPRVGRTVAGTMKRAGDTPRRVLVIDDSISTGDSLAAARRLVAERRPDVAVVYCAVYVVEPGHEGLDIALEVVPLPRVFQWNLMRHKVLGDACFDIDGVLCHDPERDENDDGERYVDFLTGARPLLMPGLRIAHLVTSRLERYRAETEGWLRASGIEYDRLWMLDLPSAAERRRQGAHASHKARVYRETGAALFIESEDPQAQEIAELSSLPVLSIEGQRIVWPSDQQAARRQFARAHLQRKRQAGKAPSRKEMLVRRFIGKRGYQRLRKILRG